jgi:oligopeptide transport system ATP-binding protein
MENNILVSVKNLYKYFPITKGIIRQHKVADIKAVDGVSFFIRKGETLGLCGESGCGKTTLAWCISRLYRPTSGEVLFEGKDITKMEGEALRQLRQRMQIIFQDPFGSLDPRMKCGDIVSEPLKVHRVGQGRNYSEQINNLLMAVGVDPDMSDRFPHELSGGERQRIGIARALSLKPSFIICDEPVSALDVSIQGQIINLLKDLQAQFSLTYLFIAHDLAVVRHMSDRVAIMYLGRIVELSSKADLYVNPLHPYTIALLSAVPIPDPVIESTRERIILTGDVPSSLNPPSGCRFHPRCPRATDICSREVPILTNIGDEQTEHQVACWLI